MHSGLRIVVVLVLGIMIHTGQAAEPAVSFEQDVAPLMRRYCAGCHNDRDREGNFSLESYASLQKGIKDQPVVLPGDAAGSLIWRVVTATDDTKMPPEGESAPTTKELATLKRWIELGAPGPVGDSTGRSMPQLPKIASQTTLNPITALACGPRNSVLAIARFGHVEIQQAAPSEKTPQSWKTLHVLTGLPGKVEAIHFNPDGGQLLTASGIAGVEGIATLWNVQTGERIRDFKGHRDILFDAELSPDGKLLATCSYDRDICLWDVASGELLRTFSGHNGAVYDIAFNPAGTVLASASADDTCKLWRVRDGERLDTLGQPLKEQYAIDFTRDGKFVIAAGADNQIRVWSLRSNEKPGINPLVVTRFAHEAPIVAMSLSSDGSRLITAAEDKTIKVWETRNFTELELLEHQPGVVAALDTSPDSATFAAGRMDGSWEILPLPEVMADTAISLSPSIMQVVPVAPRPMAKIEEMEPNDTPQQAQQIEIPTVIRGTVHRPDADSDHDTFRFAAKAGEEWVIDVLAAREKSRLDSFVEVLTTEGEPIERVLLQAVRDSYFTFRGKDGQQTGDFRLFQWDEMSLNNLLYCNGEVVKLWRAPRGPDSGFDVYPGSGERWGYFDTSGLTHALNEPCYIVRPHPPGTKLIPNGLPLFPVYFENDDAARRESGKDSKLFFTAPADGEYLLRLRDIRGSQGPGFTYAVSIRPAAPDFTVMLKQRKLKIEPGNRTELQFTVKREDQFDGPIIIELNGLPPGLTFNNPVVIEAEQTTAMGVISAAVDAVSPTATQLQQVQLLASATIHGREVTHPVPGFESITISEKQTFSVAIRPIEGGAVPSHAPENGLLEFEIHPGETLMLNVVAERNGFKDIIEFGTAESGRNLPHGVYVDNIGLNGLMMLADQSEQKFFITACDWVPEQSRLFHLRTTKHGELATLPVLLHVRRPAGKSTAQQ